MDLIPLAMGLLKVATGADPAEPVSVPNPVPALPSALQDRINLIISWAKGIVMVLGVIGLLWCAGQMVIGRTDRHRMAVEGAKGIPWVLLGALLVAVGAPLLTLVM